jgi:integrase
LFPHLLPQMGKRLTQLSIKKIKADPTKRLEVPDSTVPGLYLLVQPSGKRSWAVRYRYGGKTRKLTLEAFYDLATARKQARETLDKVAGGHDPAAEKRARVFFGEVAQEFVERYVRPSCRATHAHEVERMLRKDVLPLWGNKRIQEINRRDVLTLLDHVADRGGGVTANRVLATVGKLFNWAVARSIITSSPAFGLEKPVAESARDRVLTDEELALFWRACSSVPYPYGPFGKLLLLTGQRRCEVGGMRWSEIAGSEWLLPAPRTKNNKAHVVPLSNAVMELIAIVPRIAGDFVLTLTGERAFPDFSKGKKLIDAAMPLIPHWTFHDLRRTTASGMARLGIALPVIEKVLNHTSGSFAGIVGVYQRHSFTEEKRQALDLWAEFVARIAK